MNAVTKITNLEVKFGPLAAESLRFKETNKSKHLVMIKKEINKFKK